MFAIDKSDTNSNYTETSIKQMSNDGTSSQGSGFSYLRHKSSAGAQSIKSSSTQRYGIRSAGKSAKYRVIKSSSKMISDDGSSKGQVLNLGGGSNFDSSNLSDMAGLENVQSEPSPKGEIEHNQGNSVVENEVGAQQDEDDVEV